MELAKISDLMEAFAPLETQEEWDNCGFQIFSENKDIKRVMLALSVTQDVINQAKAKKCDLIISHHPLFFIPFDFNVNIPIYSAHTNLDKAKGGTTDTLIELLGIGNIQVIGDFLRVVELKNDYSLDDFVSLLKEKLTIKNLRVVNNKNLQKLRKIAFCAGSGAEFLGDAEKLGIEAIVTGDVKYHTALESNVIIIDVGHFESERPVLKTIEGLLKPLNLEVFIADEKSPFINY